MRRLETPLKIWGLGLAAAETATAVGIDAAADVIARDASVRSGDDIHAARRGVTYVTASAGDHGPSVAAGTPT